MSRTSAAPDQADGDSRANTHDTRTIIMVIIMFMVLLAVLIEVTARRRSPYRKVLD